MRSKSRIQIVDDDDALRDSMVMLLETLDYSVRSWPSGEAFLAAFEQGDTDCVVVDIRMTGMSGFDLATKLGTLAPSLPIILMSGHSDAELSDRARMLGVKALIEKPFRIEELQRAIATALAPGEPGSS